MSQHQKKQGYYPSLNSMFLTNENRGHGSTPSSLFFIPDSQPQHHQPPHANRSLYSSDMLPQPSVAPSQIMYSGMHPQHHTQPPQQMPPQSQYPSYAGPSRPAPPLPAPPLPRAPTTSHIHTRTDSDRITRAAQSDPSPNLRIVNLPRESLPRFLAIAKANTALNKETCGLLLGKDRGDKFVVTTLLIPKQHSTSDTCTMDEEELVLQFTEERSLITLGWVGFNFGVG